ncbi:MAG: DNA polymerase III subunit beta [Clostridia bacterium]
MKFVCEGLDLSEAIAKVSKAVASKAVEENQLMGCIKLDAYDNVLTLFATDGELAILKRIKAEVIEEGSVAIAGMFMVEFVRRLSNEQIEFTLSPNYMMRIRYTDSEVFAQCLDSMEYPLFKTLLNPQSVSIVQKELKELIDKSVFCVAAETNGRAVLRGCLVEVENYKMTFVALDGYRLMRICKPVESKMDKISAIIPGRSLLEVSKIITDEKELVSLHFENDYVMFDFGSTKVLTRLLAGEFIKYDHIIPSEFCTEITINREMMLKSLDRANILSRTDVKTSVVTLNIHENLMTVTGNGKMGNITENINITMKGKDMKIAFNIKYLLDFLSNVDEEFLKIKFASSIAPCIITPVTNADDSAYFYLVLPIRINFE